MTFPVLKFGCLLVTVIIGVSCKKKSADPEPEPASTTTAGSTGGPLSTAGFTWTTSGTQTIADSAFYVQGGWGSGIRAYKGGSLRFEINFQPTTLSASTYTLSSGSGLTYIDNNQYYDDQSGTFRVTSVANNKASGNYSGTGINSASSATVALTVQFADIPKR